MKMITKYMRKWSPWKDKWKTSIKYQGKILNKGEIQLEHIQSTAYFH